MLAGVLLLLYPTVSEFWNSYHQTRAVITYAETVSAMEEQERAKQREAAQAYNAELLEKQNRFRMSEAEQERYDVLLDVTGTGIMGYVEIPGIKVSLPIYHGTGEAALQSGAGHIEGTSLPVGGESTHAALSGHRGLPSARLFTDLDKMKEGDIFTLHVLGETLTYEVDRILTVEPDEVEALEILPGEDLCTLVTCTPYGINSHRLLVRGHRIETAKPETVEDAAAMAPEEQEKPGMAFLWVFAAVLAAAAAAVILFFYKKKKSGHKSGMKRKRRPKRRRRKRKRGKKPQNKTSKSKEGGR